MNENELKIAQLFSTFAFPDSDEEPEQKPESPVKSEILKKEAPQKQAKKKTVRVKHFLDVFPSLQTRKSLFEKLENYVKVEPTSKNFILKLFLACKWSFYNLLGYQSFTSKYHLILSIFFWRIFRKVTPWVVKSEN